MIYGVWVADSALWGIGRKPPPFHARRPEYDQALQGFRSRCGMVLADWSSGTNAAEFTGMIPEIAQAFGRPCSRCFPSGRVE